MRDFSGQKFGRLTAIRPIGKDKTNHTLWECKCDCGNYKTVVAYCLTKSKGGARSCGCLAHEYAKSGNARRTHGGCGTRLYRIWKDMKNRCNNPNCPDYQKWYGSRGIKVCSEWNADFETFKNWALTNGYEENLSIDRIDVNGDYCPQNCRWATAFEQRHNRRDSLCATKTDSEVLLN